MSVVLSNFEHEASQTIKAMDRPGTQRSVSWVRVRFLQRAHILANEAAARAGRGQAIAPTMDELLWVIQRSIVGAMACPRPGALQKSHAHPFLTLRGFSNEHASL